MKPKLWELEPGDEVVLDFKGDRQLSTVVSKIGEGEDRRIVFRSNDSHRSGEQFEWEAYRYKNRWSYGSSADRLRLVASVERGKPQPQAE